MHRRHGVAVRRVVEVALVRHAGNIIDEAVPPTSLLAAITRGGVKPPPAPAVLAEEAGVSAEQDAATSIFPLRLSFDPDAGPRLHIAGLGAFSVAHFDIVDKLRPYHAQGCAASGSTDHEFVAPGRFGNKELVRQHVRRCRSEFSTAYEAVEHRAPDNPILIQNQPRRGYRLDPEARFVENPAPVR
jgi:hypothetical protein